MLGQLPTTLTVDGRTYSIRTDFRDILRVIAAFHDDDLTDAEKAFVCLRNVYKDFDNMPEEAYSEAYKAAVGFIDYGIREDRPSPQVIDWEHDESIIFPAINAAAGHEVRADKSMHWWTFVGHFQSIDRESTLGVVLMIRQKKAKHKKLEKWEQEFFNANRNMCDLKLRKRKAATPESELAQLYAELLKAQKEGGEDGDGA